MSSFLKYTDVDNMSLNALIETAGQISALLSYVDLIDTPQHDLPQRTTTHVEPEHGGGARRCDDLERNALGRKRRKPLD